MTTTPGLDIGHFSKRTILTGAGWTRNWGGQLASEIWQVLMSNRAIQARLSVRELLLQEGSFEAVLGKLQTEPFIAAALPPLGCGLGGLNWRDVRPMIENSFSELSDVRVLLFQPFGAPDIKIEGGLKVV